MLFGGIQIAYARIIENNEINFALQLLLLKLELCVNNWGYLASVSEPRTNINT
jgi:hypothetical protein